MNSDFERYALWFLVVASLGVGGGDWLYENHNTHEHAEMEARNSRADALHDAELGHLKERMYSLEARLESLDARLMRLDETHPPPDLIKEIDQIRARLRALETK